MRNIKLWLAVVTTLAAVECTVRAADDRGEAVKKDLEKVAGTWQLISREKDGKNAADDEVKRTTLVLTGDKYSIQVDGKTVEEGTFRIDPSQKPKAIDVHPTKPEGKVQLGIYEMAEADTIRVCFTHPGSAETRPTEFSTTKGTGHVMEMCKRAKAKKSRGQPDPSLGGAERQQSKRGNDPS
jgi:uncharacterized protein (TIGR03067 family)